MANQRVSEVLLRYKVDQASVNRVSSSFEELVTEIDSLNAELRAVGRDSSGGIGGLTRELPKAESGIESLQAEVVRLRKELLALDDVNVSPTVTVQGGGGVANGLGVVDQLGRVGSQIGGGLGGVGGQVGNAVNLVGDLAGAVSTLNPFLITGAVAIGGVSLAMSHLKEQSDAAREAAEARIAAEEAAIALSGSSLETRRARINQLESEMDAKRDFIYRRTLEIADIEAERLELWNNYFVAQTIGTFEFEAERVRLAADTATLTEKIADARDEIRDLNTEFQGLYPQVVQMESAIAGLVNGANLLAPALTNIAAGFTSLIDKARTLPGELAIAGEAEAARKASALAAAQAAQTARSDAYFKAATQTVVAQEALTKAQNAYTEAVNSSAVRISDINTKLQADLSAAETERQSALAEAARAAGDQRVKAEEDKNAEIARIQKRFNRSYEQAVGDRDALAAARAEQQRDDELDQTEDRYKAQLKTADDGLKAQQRTIEQRYNVQLQTVRAAAEAALRTEQQRAQAEINLRQQALQVAQVQLANALNLEAMTRATYYQQSIQAAVDWANQMRFLTLYGLTAPATGSTGGGGSGGRVLPTPLAEGGPAYAGRPYRVGENGPELFVPAQSGRIIPNGAAFTINVEGAQMGTIRAASRQQALAAFSGVLDRMGVA